MKQVIISTKSILIVPFLFIIILCVKIVFDYYDSKEQVYNFVHRQTKALNSFMLSHRNYYQNLYLNKTIPLNEDTLAGLPAFSAFEISRQFSQENSFDITIQTVSDRARNPKNSANESEKKAINFFNKDREKKEYFVDEGEFFQFATPLYIDQKCLSCHGEKEDAPDFISQKYENAYGYKLGELRGIVSVKVPKNKISSYFRYSFMREVFFDMSLFIVTFFIAIYLIKYFRNLAQNLEKDVREKTRELTKNVAYLNSYKLAMDESSIVSRSDLSGRIIYANDNFCKVSGYTQEEILGKPHSMIRHLDIKDDLFEDLWRTIRSKKVWKGIIKNSGKEHDYWVDTSILPILDENQNIVEYIAVRHDITKIVEQQQKLDTIANTDMLTGFGNRYKLNNDIQNSTAPALAIINIDNFSQLNDFYGHKVGDNIIIKLGLEIEKNMDKQSCLLYHLQGDEFVVFSPNTQKDSFLQTVVKLVDKISKTPLELDDEQLVVNVTTAISFEEREKILPSADMAFKVARKENKNLMIYSEEISLNSQYENNIKWTKKFKKALIEDRIVPVFQAIVNNDSGKYEKYESLVRLEEDGLFFSPYFFLDIAKKTKHYPLVTKTMIKKSFEKFKDRDLSFSINLTVEDILSSEIKSYIYKMLKKYDIANRVVFEIVESESIVNFEDVLEFIYTVKESGCKIAIDDFGTGYSNFEYLLKLKADYIKIDGSMIKNIDKDDEARAVVSVIVDFAKRMGIKTIAEFVESESIWRSVKELGIDYSQGYYFSVPAVDLKDE